MNDRPVEDYESEHRRLLEQVIAETRGTADLTGCAKLSEPVLRALAAVPRHRFVPPAQLAWAYADSPLPIGCGQTISQPFIVALMTELLALDARSVVLEVGTGSGYQAAVLSRLARRVYSIDRHMRLVREARELFDRLGLVNITAMTADGSFGLAEQAPFDRIIVTAAAEDPPGPLLAQLKIGGIMVVPVGQSDAVQTLIRVRKSDTGLQYDEIRPVRFVPLLEGLGKDG